MGVIWDIVKEIPLSGVLKEKISDLDAKLGALETENTLLKGDLRKANILIETLETENKQLQEQLNASTKPNNAVDDALDPIAHKLIAELARHHGGDAVPNYLIEGSVRGETAVVSYHLVDLKEKGYLESAGFDLRTGPRSRLTQKGKKYWMDSAK